MEPDAGYDGDGEPPLAPLEGEPAQEPEKLGLAYTLRPWAPGAEKPTKPYLVEAADYEEARERAAERVDVTGL